MRKKTSKEILVETLLEISKKKSIDKITVKEIVRESGIAMQTFYNHFLDKADLITYVHKSKFDEIISKIGKDGYTLYDATLENIEFYFEHKDFMANALINTEGQDSYARASASNLFIKLKEYVLQQNNINELSNKEEFFLKIYCISSVYAYAHWAFGSNEISKEDFADYIFELMPEAIRKYFDYKSRHTTS